MRKEVDYQARKITLQVGDLVLLYSDGFPEAEDIKRNRLGYEGIRLMLNEMETDSLSAREIGEVLKKKIISHSGQRLADDTTVIVMKIEA
jgi:serine phosphatase RsbU (regulator of sigma subunit)